jgi:hypothetical protein
MIKGKSRNRICRNRRPCKSRDPKRTARRGYDHTEYDKPQEES